MIHQSHHPSNQIAVGFQTTYVVSIHDKNSAHNLKEILPIIEITVTEARLIENVLQDSLTKNHCDHRVFESLPLLLNVESEKKERGAAQKQFRVISLLWNRQNWKQKMFQRSNTKWTCSKTNQWQGIHLWERCLLISDLLLTWNLQVELGLSFEVIELQHNIKPPFSLCTNNMF